MRCIFRTFLAIGFGTNFLFFNTIATAADNAQDATLEERVAELEASVARAGGRKVSLTVYGQVNRALLIWDDGRDSDAYVVDNDTSSTRVGFIGAGKLKDGWSAGYRIEIEFKDGASDEIFNSGDEGLGEADQLRTRHASWYIESENNGRVTLGQQSPATDDITIINLGASMSDAGIHYNNGFGLRLASGPVTTLNWGHLAHTVDTYRGDFVRYDSPVINGFLLSAAWGENDIWDAAVRYQAEWNGVRLASGIGYMDNEELNFSDVRGSISAIHTPTGLFLTAAGGLRNEQDSAFAIVEKDKPIIEFSVGDDSYFYFMQGGVNKQWFEPGKTSIYAEYGRYNNFSVGEVLRPTLGGADIGLLLNNEIDRFGLGVEQSFDASALLIYANLNYYNANVSYCEAPWRKCAAGVPSEQHKLKELAVEDWAGVVLGARIKF